MQIPRIVVDGTDGSRIENFDWPLREQTYCGSPPGYVVTDGLPSCETRLIRTPAFFVDDWHPVPEPMLCLLLTGRLGVEVGAGDSVVIEAGEMILCEDTRGRGHRMTELHGRAYDMLLVTIRA